MEPARLIESEHLLAELRDLVGNMPPAEAAGLATELGGVDALAHGALALLGECLEISATGRSGYTVYGTPAELSCGPVLRA
jgi:hypothetical protein